MAVGIISCRVGSRAWDGLGKEGVRSPGLVPAGCPPSVPRQEKKTAGCLESTGHTFFLWGLPIRLGRQGGR